MSILIARVKENHPEFQHSPPVLRVTLLTILFPGIGNSFSEVFTKMEGFSLLRHI